MKNISLSVCEIRDVDIEPLSDYWFNSDPDFLFGMGVDLAKMPSRDEWKQLLNEQINQPYKEKKSYCIIWLENGEAIGHSNVNKIIFGEEAFMHLHIWEKGIRKKGAGTELVKMTLPLFFENLKLKKIYCEPYALNPAPNKVMGKAGFEFKKNYVTTPGWINYEQPVNLWEMTLERFEQIVLK